MRLIFTLFLLIPLTISGYSQKLTGIWRGYFSSTKGYLNGKPKEETYKYEVQINQLSNNGTQGVTYSYKTTIFYGKATFTGIYNPATKSLLLKENKLEDLKVADKSEPCLMTCYLDYSKLGKLEVLEGTFISTNMSDKSDCGNGKVYLEKVPVSDFKKENFLVQKMSKPATNTQKPIPAIPRKSIPDQPNNSRNTPILPQPLVKKSPKNIPDRIPETPMNASPQKSTLNNQSINRKNELPIPSVLRDRENNLIRTIQTSENFISIDLYDNGTIDNDTISVYHNNKLVVKNSKLQYNAINFKINCSPEENVHEIVIVAENLGDIPPNTALMVIKAGKERFEVFLSSNEKRNAKLIINYVPK